MPHRWRRVWPGEGMRCACSREGCVIFPGVRCATWWKSCARSPFAGAKIPAPCPKWRCIWRPGLLPVLRESQEVAPGRRARALCGPTGPLALATKLLTGVPYVLTAHLGDVPGGVPEQTDHLFRLVGPLVKPVWRAARQVTAVSRFTAELAARAYGVEPTVIPNGVPPIPPPQVRVAFSPAYHHGGAIEHSEKSAPRPQGPCLDREFGLVV